MSKLLDYVINVETKDHNWKDVQWDNSTRKYLSQDIYPCVQQSEIGHDITALLVEPYTMREVLNETIDFGMLNMTRLEALSLVNSIIAYSFADIYHRVNEGMELKMYIPKEDKSIDISTLTFVIITLLVSIAKFIIYRRKKQPLI